MRNAYDKWLAGEGCCNANNFIHIETSDCKKQDVCDCEHILLEISNLHTDDLVLQNEIDELSSGYTPDLSNYVKQSELNQYVLNLQEQINSLITAISGCCGSQSGETQYRWVTMTGENDYWCSGTTKYSKEKEQSSTDGINWTDTGSERSGSTVLEENCVDCGYVPSYGTKLIAHYNNGNSKTIMCAGEWEDGFIYNRDYEDYETGITGLTSVEIGVCPTKIAGYGFSGCTSLSSVTFTNNITDIGAWSFADCDSLSSITIPSSVILINQSAFKYCRNLTSFTSLATTPPQMGDEAIRKNDGLVIYVPAESVNAYKSARYWSAYADNIQAI